MDQSSTRTDVNGRGASWIGVLALLLAILITLSGSGVAQAALSTPPPADLLLVGNEAADLTASAAFVVDITSGVLIYAENADTQLPPASTVKIVTALVVVRVLDPNETVTVQELDLVDRMVYSNAQLEAGDQALVRDLLAGLLLPSGGDAALALARVAGERLGPAPGQSPVDRFVEEMNAIGRAIGMQNSSFVNPVGMDDDRQVSTARDLAIAAEALLRDPTLAPIVAAEQLTIEVGGPFARSITLVNTNALLSSERVHGVKTGTTASAGQCLVLATTRSGSQIVSVVLGSEDRYADSQRLFSFIDERIEWVTFSGERFPSLGVAAERYGFSMPIPLVAPLTREQAAGLYYRLELGPRPNGGGNEGWGVVVFLSDGREMYRLPVIAGSP